MARCTVYEIQGPDPSHTASAKRCLRDATELAVVGSRVVGVCERHVHKPWELVGGTDGWVYAVNLNADAPTKKKKNVFGVPSTAQSVRAVAKRALEHDDEEVRALAGRLLAELDRHSVRRR